MITAADRAEQRRQRAHKNWKCNMRETGCKLPTQESGGWSKCFCGAEIDIADMDGHVIAAHLEHVCC